MTSLELAFALGGFLCGIAGTWSPCGFSMITTLGRAGYAGARRTTALGCATLALAALAGGAATFGTLALLGSLVRVAGSFAVPLAVAATVVVAWAEARGARIIPQVRRQVPEHWRRTLPLPIAAAGYGLLLGLGVRTFILTLAFWALAGLTLAAGDPSLGVLTGLAFGLGRAMPIALVAPLDGSAIGARILVLMAERTGPLRGVRAASAATVAIGAFALVAGDARAAGLVAAQGTDPTVASEALAWQVPKAGGMLLAGGRSVRLPGDMPALGGQFVAWRAGEQVVVVRRGSLAPVATITVKGVDKIALSERWLVYRVTRGERVRLWARSLPDLARRRLVASVRAPRGLGRPAVAGNLTVFHVAGPRASTIVAHNLATGRTRVLRRSAGTQYLNPSLTHTGLLYVAVSSCYQQLVLDRRRSRRGGRVLLRLRSPSRRDSGREPEHTSQGVFARPCPRRRARSTPAALLWTTALSSRAAYVTQLRLHGTGTTSSILRVGV